MLVYQGNARPLLDVVRAYFQNYCDKLDLSLNKGDTPLDTLKALLELPNDASADTINRVIGNDSWTTCDKCTQCGDLVRVGKAVYFGSTLVCVNCIEKANHIL